MTENLWNAVTMLFPLFMTIHLYLTQPISVLFVVANMLHHPFSIAYHIEMYMNPLRKFSLLKFLDLAFIHVGCMIYICLLTTCRHYIGLNWILNLYWISQISECSNKNSKHILYGYLTYSLPILLNGHLYHYVCAMGYTVVCGIIYRKRIFGIWSHPMFHVCLNGVLYHVIQSTVEPI